MKPKTASEIAALRESGRMLAAVLQLIDKTVKPGMSGADIEKLSLDELTKLGGEPIFQGFQGFPSAICISVNEGIVHGVPTDKPFKSGDIVGFDFGVRYNGMITDSAFTKVIGEEPVPNDVKRLLQASREALDAGIKQVRPGARVGDIGAAVQKRLRRSKLGIITSMAGHGVGHEIHEPPQILNVGKAGTGEELKSGMSIAIEPMATLGGPELKIDRDKWTARSKDGSMTAHFEHTVLVTDDGHEVVTRWR